MATFYHGVMIDPSLNDPYVYLTTLMYHHTHLDKEVDDLYRKTGKEAYNLIQSSQKRLRNKQQTDRMDQALTFLLQISQQQRTHEVNFLRAQLEKLESREHGKAEEELIRLLRQAISSNDGSVDYKLLIQAFNSLLTGIREYKGRLANLNSKDYKNELERNLIEGAEATIANYTDTRSKFYYSQEELTRQLVQRYLTNSPQGQQFLRGLVNENGAKQFAAAAILLQQSLAKYLCDNELLQYEKNSQKLSGKDTYSFNEFKNKLEELDQQLGEFYLKADNLLEDDSLIDDAIQLYGLNISEKKMSRRGNGSKQYRAARDKIKQLEEVVSNPIKNNMVPNSAAKWLPYIRVQFSGNKRISFQKELETRLSAALSQGFSGGIHMGDTNTGTDSIMTITVGISAPERVEDTQARNILTSLKHDIENAGRASTSAEEMSKIYVQRMQELEDMVEDMQKCFVLHETTKYYTTIEQHQKKAFEGRNLKILNYISQIKEFGGTLGINTDWLTFAAYNMLDGAVGAGNRDHLLSVLATFAGILMFDDFAIVAKESANEISFESIENIHLYSLNSVYIPASLFLQATYNAFKQQQDDLLNGMGFSLQLNEQPDISWTPKHGHPTEGDWRTWREKASNVSVTMLFAANFLSFVANL